MLTKPFTLLINHSFSVQRALPGYSGKCGQLHTTYFKLQLEIATIEPPANGFVVDFYQIKNELENLLDPMVGQVLNDRAPFDQLTPSTENVAKWLYEQCAQFFDAKHAALRAVTVWENEDFAARYAI